MIHDDTTMEEGIGLFYDLWESKMHKLHIPETIHMSCLASCHGWLLLSAPRGGTVFLLNPLTRARIQLPPFISTQFKRLTASKVTFSTYLTDPNCLIMVFHQRMKMIHWCQVGDSCWTNVTGGPLHDFSVIRDATYCNGRFYLLYEGAMEIIESNKPEERTVYYFEPKLQYLRMCFLEGNSGVYVAAFLPIVGGYKIYSVANDRKKGTVMTLKTKIELYQFQEQFLVLEQITDTNKLAIFSELGDFFLAVCCDDWGLVDCVGGKYIDVRGSWAESNYHICSTKLDNGKSEVVCDLDAEHIFRSLIWFQPSFE